jgi:hypothetical protein
MFPILPPERGLDMAAGDLDVAATTLARHKVLQLAVARLSALGEAGACLQARIEPAAVRARHRAQAAQEMVRLLPGIAGPDVVMAGMKGVAAVRWYSSPRQRDVSDVDIWVPDAEHATRLQRRLSAELGYLICPDELPWFKLGPRGAYGVMMLHPSTENGVHIDVHFGDYSVAHCASFPVRPGLDGDGLAMLATEDNICCGIANAAGDHFVDLKSLNDLALSLRRDDVDWARVRATLHGVGLLGFLGVMIDWMPDIFEIDDVAREGIQALGRLPRQDGPPSVAPVARKRCRATVRHALGIGRRVSMPHAVRLAWTAYRYYRRPLTLRVTGGPWLRPFRVQPTQWTCTRLIPQSTVEQWNPGPVPRSWQRTAMVAEGIELVRTRHGDLIRLGGEVYLPTVYYRVRPRHAAMAAWISRSPAAPITRGVISDDGT